MHDTQSLVLNLLVLIGTGLSVPAFFIVFFLILGKKKVDEGDINAEYKYRILNGQKRGISLLLVSWVILFVTFLVRAVDYGRWDHSKIDESDFPDKKYVDGAYIVGGSLALWVVGVATVLRYHLNTDFAKIVTILTLAGSAAAIFFAGIADKTWGEALYGAWILFVVAVVSYLSAMLMYLSPVWNSIQMWSARYWMQWLPALNLTLIWLGWLLVLHLDQPLIKVSFFSSERWVGQWTGAMLILVGSWAQGIDYLMVYPDNKSIDDVSALPQHSEGHATGGRVAHLKVRQRKRRD